jgi:hypothetical protein
VKDLSLLGRDLSKMIMVDNVAENFQLQKNNGIFIKTWFNDGSDTFLYDLKVLLVEIGKKTGADVRNALLAFRDSMTRLIALGESPINPRDAFTQVAHEMKFENDPSPIKSPRGEEVQNHNGWPKGKDILHEDFSEFPSSPEKSTI